MADAKCETCIYFKRENSDLGTCHRNAPTPFDVWGPQFKMLLGLSRSLELARWYLGGEAEKEATWAAAELYRASAEDDSEHSSLFEWPTVLDNAWCGEYERTGSSGPGTGWRSGSRRS